jgi:hypothetical protein
MKRTARVASLVVPGALVLSGANAGEVTGLTTFTTGTPAKAAEVNGNFNAVKTAVDDNHARINALQTGIAAIDTRVTALEAVSDLLGPLMYGDGSAGDLVVTGSVTWGNSAAPPNLNFNNCTIQSGAELIVGGGLTLRCAGAFKNEGTLRVAASTPGGLIDIPKPGVVGTATFAPVQGDFPTVARLPAFDADGSYTDVITDGLGASGALKTYVISNLPSLRIGGSGGSGSVGLSGGAGGGLLKILVSGPLSNTGAIFADGTSGAGGGGGGVVVLASRSSVSNVGTISARGGAGDGSQNVRGASGGGGGGIIVLVAPSVVDSGSMDVSGGAGGSTGTPVNFAAYRAGGGGGGGSGGGGGRGAPLDGPTLIAGERGSDGFIIRLQLDRLFVVR